LCPTFSAHQSIDRSLYIKDGQIQGQAQERYVCSSFTTPQREVGNTTERSWKRIEEDEEQKRGKAEREKDKELMIRNGPTTMSTPPLFPFSMFRNNR
jgi:hypothetical protein